MKAEVRAQNKSLDSKGRRMEVLGGIEVSILAFVDGTRGLQLRCKNDDWFGTGERGGIDENIRYIERRAAVQLHKTDIEKLIEIVIREKMVAMPGAGKAVRAAKRTAPTR